jgi:hypothetical protein
MRRTQVYLDENIWKMLHRRARGQGTSVSELVRRAVSEKYGSQLTNRKQAMQALIGLRKNRRDLPSTKKYIRFLRKRKG